MTYIGPLGQLVPTMLSINVWNDGERLYVDAYRVYLDGPTHEHTAPADAAVSRYLHEDTGTTAGSRSEPCDQPDRLFDAWHDADADGLRDYEALVKENPELTTDQLWFVRASVAELYAELCPSTPVVQ